jgi:HTH-type transcriptional regulator, cell division transcriptional repressor
MQMKKTLGSPTAKAERLTQLRKLAKLSRNDIAQMVGCSVLTYKGWENARFGGIPQKRAAMLVEALQTEGIESSVDWLIQGIGDQPKKILHYQVARFKEAIANPTKQTPENIEQLCIKAELEFFCNNNDWETIFITLPDDAMEPYFLQGDLVAGVKIPNEDFDKIIGLNCIVRTKNNKILLRQIQKSNTKDFFTLLSLNPDSKQPLILHDMELIDIAPAIWFRRKTILPPKIAHKK